ncbi:MAG TPA: glycosyltransferase family 4 protein [Candidatus Binatia bacterium]|jgi:glycosyltransferase involved in cell wall biosynthesis|nr:glycosyltransferase family 4 protein [Candidatus Binatia bacterium]
MRLLLFNLATDADDPILGFTTQWIRALAQRVDFIHVITMRAGRLEMPANVRVYSVGKEKGYNEPRRAFEFYRILARTLREERVDVCFSHMMPLFTVMAGPILKPMGIPIITWYAHLNLTWMLRVAHWLSARMVASVSNAYPYRRDKFIAIGQGIDTGLLSPGAEITAEPIPLILCVGRLSPVKDHPTLIKAAGILREIWQQPYRVAIVGGPATSRDEPYVRSLHQLVKQLGLEKTVHLEPAVSMDRLPEWYRRSAVNVNMTPTGSGDKVVWEAMACGRLCVVANEGFRETLGNYADSLVYAYGEAEQLAERLKWVLSLSRDERLVMEMYLRGRVESMHGIDRLAQNLVNIFESAIYSKAALGCTKTNP